MKELKTMNVNEIKNIARAMGIKGWWDMKKAQLIEAIENHQQTEPLIDEPELVPMPGTEGEWIHPADKETSKDEPIEEIVPEVSETTEVEEDINTNENKENMPEVIQDAHRKNQKRLLTYKGKTQSLNAWAKDFGIRHQVLYYRIVIKGWDVEKAFETPFKKSNKEVI